MKLSGVCTPVLSAIGLTLALTACETVATAPEPEASETTAPAIVETVSSTEVSIAAISSAIDRAKSTSGPGEPAMWTFADADTTIHLFGTVHLLRPETDWRSDAFEAAFTAADTLVLETDAISPEAQAKAQNLIQQYGLFTDGNTLTSVLSDEQKAQVAEAATTVGIPVAAFESLKPWLVSLQLGLTQIQKEGYDPNAGLEQVLTAEATASGKSFAYLETIEEQLAVLGGAPLEDQIDGLILTALTIETGSVVLDTLVEEWVDGDVAGLGAMVAEPAMIGGVEAYEALLVNRNANWVPQLKDMLDTPGVKLVAVGAGHLVGPDSVVAMLRADGVTVTGP